MTSQLASRLKFLATSVGVVGIAGLVLAGCSLGTRVKSLLSPNQTAPAGSSTDSVVTYPTSTSTTPVTNTQPTTVQPTTTSDQDMTNESNNLKKLDQGAVTVDKSMNDQAINVN